MNMILAVVLTLLASAVADDPSCTIKDIPLPMGTIRASSVDDQFTPGDIHYRNCSDVPFIVAKTHIGWCPDPHDQSPRIQIDLPKQMSVYGIVFQTIYTQCADKSHDYGSDGFMRTFDLQYVLPGDHDRNLVTYGKDLNALDEMSAERKFEFTNPIVTNTLSLVPRQSNVWPCFRFKLYGCDAEELCPADFCLNGGTCSGKNFCSCPRGFFGNQCNQTVADVNIYNYGFQSIVNNTLKTPDADFLVNEFVTLVSDRKRDHHGHHHNRPGHSCHFHGNHHGHHGHCEYHSNNHHDSHHNNHHGNNHGHAGMSNSGPHSHCMANLHSGHHGFTTSMNVHFGQNHQTHGHTYLYSNGGNIAGHNGASLSYHNNHLHFHVSTDTHHWHASHPCNLLTGLWNTITTSWHPHQGAQIHINNNHVASCTNPKPNPQPCTNQVNLRLGDGHVSANVNINLNVKLNFDLSIQGLISAALSSVSLSNLGINSSGAFTTPAPTTTSTTTTTTTTTPKPTTQPPVTATSTHPSVPSTTSGPYTPICYSYTNEASVGASTNSQKCAVGEVCSLFEDKHGYTAKCLSKTLCDAGQRLAGGQCWECCDSYLCNDQCTSVKTNCQDKPTCAVMIATGYDVCKDPKMSVDLCSKTCNLCSSP